MVSVWTYEHEICIKIDTKLELSDYKKYGLNIMMNSKFPLKFRLIVIVFFIAQIDFTVTIQCACTVAHHTRSERSSKGVCYFCVNCL